MNTQMLEKLFVAILNMSLTACIVIPVVMLFRLLLRKAPKFFSYILWSVVLFRLVCPVSFSASFSLLGALDAPKTEQGQIAYISLDTEQMSAAVNPQFPTADVSDGAASMKTPAEGSMEDSMENARESAAAAFVKTALTAGTWIWLAGVSALLLYSVVTLVNLKRKLKAAGHERDNIYTVKNLETPFVCGFFSPRIYLPAALTGGEKEYILLHEQIHIRRCDHIVKLLSYLALCVHWFNPLVWAAFFLSGRDMEMSCDEAVIRRMGSSVKKEYSASLLNLATGRRIVGGVPLAFGEGDTGGRIKNVLRYKKPAAVLTGVAVIALVAAAAVLLANPRKVEAEGGKEPAGENAQTVPDALYGIVGEYDGRHVVTIPVYGVVELDADNVETYFEPDEDGEDLRAGDLVEIHFAKGADVQVMETYPGQFSVPVEHVYIMRRGMALSYQAEEDRYRISFPIGGPAVIGGEDVEEGDMLQIYRTDAYGENETPWRMVRVQEVDREKNLASIELSPEDTVVFLAELNYTISRAYIKVQDSGEDGVGAYMELQTGGTDSSGQGSTGAGSGGQGSTEAGADGQDGADIGSQVKGFLHILEMSEKEPRTITVYSLYKDNGEQSFNDVENGGEPLVFAENCVYRINRAMETFAYEEVSYEEFMDALADEAAAAYEDEWHQGMRGSSAELWATIADNRIVEVEWRNPLSRVYGIYYCIKYPSYGYYDLTEIAGEDMLEQYYELAGTETFDVADSDGDEQIEIYTGNIGDGDSGLVLFRNAEGSLLYCEFAHMARVDWNNVYLGEADGTGFIMNLHIEDRDDTGQYSYCVYRLSAEGEIRQIAGSSFEWGLGLKYSDELFAEWMEPLTYYLEHSHLILSSQDGEIRTERVSEADVYNYETLSLKDRDLTGRD